VCALELCEWIEDCARFELLTAVFLNIQVLGDLTYRLVNSYEQFEGW